MLNEICFIVTFSNHGERPKRFKTWNFPMEQVIFFCYFLLIARFGSIIIFIRIFLSGLQSAKSSLLQSRLISIIPAFSRRVTSASNGISVYMNSNQSEKRNYLLIRIIKRAVTRFSITAESEHRICQLSSKADRYPFKFRRL